MLSANFKNMRTTHSFLYCFNNSEAKRVLIVLTDGPSRDSVTQPAQKLKNDGVIIYSIGVGSGISRSELITMASLPSNEHVVELNNFGELASFAKKMSSIVCHGEYD